MCWARGRFELIAQRPRGHRRPRAIGVHRGWGRREGDLDTFIAQQFQIRIQSAGVGVEILTRTELQRIDEDRHHHNGAGHPLGRTDECTMTLV